MFKEHPQQNSFHWIMIFIDRAELLLPGESTQMEGVNLSPSFIEEIEILINELSLDITVSLKDGGVIIDKTTSK